MIYKCRKCFTMLSVGINWYDKGLSSKNFICNECLKLYYQENKDKINSQSKAWRERNTLYMQEYGKQYRELNKDKTKDQNLKWHYNLSLDEYKTILHKQNYCCAICKTDTPGGRGGTFHVDHSHTTGKVRGLLCHHCNTALGKFKDDPIILEAAIKYLNIKERYK